MSGTGVKEVTRTAPGVANDATDLNQVGTEFVSGAKKYRYVLVEDMALAANDVVSYADATGGEVTQDRSGGASISNDFAGVAVNTATDAYYTYVQVSGLATCKVAANTAVLAGARVMLSASADGAVATYAATTGSEDRTFGVALANDTATTSVAGTVAVMIDVR